MLDQRGHRRIETVELAELDRETFAQIARTDAGRIELLQHRQHGVDIILRRAKPIGGLAEIARQVAGLIDQVDQVLADHALGRRGEGDRKLLGEMIRQRHLGGNESLKIIVLVGRGPAAPFGVGRGRGILRGACGGFRRLLGKHIVGIGGNEEAARLVGIKVKTYRLAIYAVTGLISGFAGLVLMSRLGSGQPTAGAGLELSSIAAVVLGGTRITGGQGTLIGTFFGALLITILGNGLDLMNVGSFYQLIFVGVVLLAAVIISRLTER